MPAALRVNDVMEESDDRVAQDQLLDGNRRKNMRHASTLDGCAELSCCPVRDSGRLAWRVVNRLTPGCLVVTRSRKRTGALLPEAGGSLLADHARLGCGLRRLLNPLGLHLLCPLPYPLEFGLPGGFRGCLPCENSIDASLIICSRIIVY